MVTIIDESTQSAFNNRFYTEDSIVVPIYSDTNRHRHNNTISLIFVEFMNGDKFVIPKNHPDAKTVLNPEVIRESNEGISSTRYTYNSDDFFPMGIYYGKMIDVNLLQYVDTATTLDLNGNFTSAHTFVKRKFGRYQNLNHIVPLLKHVESAEVLSSKLRKVIEQHKRNLTNPTFTFLNDTAKDVFNRITMRGIHVDPKIIVDHFGIDMRQHITNGNLMYTEYNMYTTTGRPSNRFGKLNFAALDKSTGIRAALTSRWGNDGMLIQFDYEAYHLRLIADILGYKFPEGNVHNYLGRYYFKTDTLTPEQYDESKETSFKMLYGGVDDEYKHISFFKSVDGLVKALWLKFKQDGELRSLVNDRALKESDLSSMYPQKLFNYFIQMHETESNIVRLHEALKLFVGKNSQIVLYTYDSILIDFHKDDGLNFLKDVKKVMEMDGKFPMKVSGGKNYDTMQTLMEMF